MTNVPLTSVKSDAVGQLATELLLLTRSVNGWLPANAAAVVDIVKVSVLWLTELGKLTV